MSHRIAFVEASAAEGNHFSTGMNGAVENPLGTASALGVGFKFVKSGALADDIEPLDLGRECHGHEEAAV